MTIYEPILLDPEPGPTDAELNDRSLFQTIPAEDEDDEESPTYEPQTGICEKCRRLRHLHIYLCGWCREPLGY